MKLLYVQKPHTNHRMQRVSRLMCCDKNNVEIISRHRLMHRVYDVDSEYTAFHGTQALVYALTLHALWGSITGCTVELYRFAVNAVNTVLEVCGFTNVFVSHLPYIFLRCIC